MYGYIYKTTNLVNDKIYIGQHKANIFTCKYIGSGKLLRKAINRYGKNNFVVELLKECHSKEELDEEEIKYIKLYNSTDTNIGYNILKGGQKRFFTGQKHSAEAKAKMSYRAKNRPHLPTTKNRICITNGTDNHMILIDELSSWEDKGWYKGKTMVGKPAWNKGLTKNDPRVQKYTTSRNKHFEMVKAFGCFGVKGNQHGFKKGKSSWNKGYHRTTHDLSIELKNK